MSNPEQYEHDAFISHASEDKETFVRGFAIRLMDLGLKVWYDEFTLDVGDSLSASIDKGLVHSRYGIVVLSNDFLRKDWPEYELRSLLMLQVGGRKRILPIWHNLDRETLLKYSPYLADKIALNTREGLDLVSLRIVRIVRPDIFKGIEAWVRFRQMVAEAEVKYGPLDEIKLGPRVRTRLTDAQMRRVRIICSLLDEISPTSFERAYDSYLRDLPVEDEIQHWEWLALVIHLYRARKGCSLDEAQRLFRFLLMADLTKMAEAVGIDARMAELREKTGLDIDLLFAIIHETNRHPELSEEDTE